MEPLRLTKTITFNKVSYLIKAEADENKRRVNVTVLKCYEKDGQLSFDKKETNIADVTTDLDQAERTLTGNITDDGCSNLHFYPDNGAERVHYCSMEQAMNIGLIVGECYFVTKELIGEAG